MRDVDAEGRWTLALYKLVQKDNLVATWRLSKCHVEVLDTPDKLEFVYQHVIVSREEGHTVYLANHVSHNCICNSIAVES